MARLLREPLLHFAVLGGVMFAVAALRRPGGDSPAPEPSRIVISAGHLEQMITGFTRTWHRPPTREELAGLIEDQVREEVLSREAIAIGLDRDDTIIRRRLRQKMEYLIDDESLHGTPSDEVLRTFFQTRLDSFRTEARTAFEHVYVDFKKREEAATILASLTAGGASDSAGDPFLLPLEFGPTPRGDIVKMFGEPFARQLDQAPTGSWSGPLESGYGLHLVRIRERIDAGHPDFADVKDDVRRRWFEAKRKEAADTVYRKLRERYTVVVEPPKPSVPAKP